MSVCDDRERFGPDKQVVTELHVADREQNLARFPLDRDTICRVVGRAGNAVVPLQRMLARQIDPEGQVLARLVPQDRPAVLGAQHEGGDDLALPALALDPEIVFLDEPTSGLDPIGAGEFDDLIATLQRTLGLTVFMVTHDLDSLYSVCDRIAALGEGKILAEGPIEVMLESDHPWLRSYFHGKRARAVMAGGA